MDIVQIVPAAQATAWFTDRAYDVILWGLTQGGRVVGIVLIEGVPTRCDTVEGFIRYDVHGGMR